MGLFLGIDAGTQSIKGLLIDPERNWCSEPISVHFGHDLPQYGSPDGYLPNENPQIRHANPLMWLDALELLLQRMKDAGLPLSQIQAVSGSGQQHGSVFLNSQFPTILANLKETASLASQIAPALIRKTSPIWMDRSTAAECGELRERFGTLVQTRTGSVPTERFTGPQIRKFHKDSPDEYRNTGYIHLVSSFLCSVLAGKSAVIDYGDGAGMNMLNLNTLQWDPEITEFTAPGLVQKLPIPASPAAIAGKLSPYFRKYGLCPGIPVVVWSGDNPNSLIGTGCAHPGTVGISLGTSDTVFAPMHSFLPDAHGTGHIMGNPAGGFMSLICFTNGALARDRIRKKHHADWEFFDHTACKQTPPGNQGKLILPWFEPESTPLQLKPGAFPNYDEATISPAEEIRAILESQALAMRLHTQWLPEKITRIRLTGGSSKAVGFRQILADVFQAEVETIEMTESAALGAAMRAANAVGGYSFPELEKIFCKTVHTIFPQEIYTGTYAEALARYAEWEQQHRLNVKFLTE